MPHRVRIQGVPVDALTLPELLDAVAGRVEGRTRTIIAYVNVHVFNEAARDPRLTRFLAGADICYCDGNGVVLASRILGDPLPGRMTGADWIHDLCARAAAEGWRIAWVGGKPGVTEKAARILEARWTGVRFVATEHGYHPAEEEDALLARIEAAQPDILLVGMGTPLQERWAERARPRLSVPVIWCLGATADFVAGEVSRGPAFLHRDHEWLARLLTEPRRLGRRFLLGNPLFVARVVGERLRREKHG